MPNLSATPPADGAGTPAETSAKIAEVIQPEHVFAKLDCVSKKALFDQAARFASDICGDIDQMTILDSLMSRERLGNTCIGHGVAVPHSRLTGLEQTFTLFLSLRQAIDFDSADRREVDVFFITFSPENACEEYLRRLAVISEFCNDSARVDALREMETKESLRRFLLGR